MIGKRLEDGDFPVNEGEYSKFIIEGNTVWLIKPPGSKDVAIIGRPNKNGSPYHWVQENADGTITVRPNPPDAPPERRNSNSIMHGSFHGYIYNGVWT